jgi:hypothetical protein
MKTRRTTAAKIKSPARRTASTHRKPAPADRTLGAGESFTRINKIRDKVDAALRKIDNLIESIHADRAAVLQAWRSLDTKTLLEGRVISADDAEFIRRWRKSRG